MIRHALRVAGWLLVFGTATGALMWLGTFGYFLRAEFRR